MKYACIKLVNSRYKNARTQTSISELPTLSIVVALEGPYSGSKLQLLQTCAGQLI